MVVVVRDEPSIWVILAVVTLVLSIAALIFFFLITGGRGTVLVLAIPGFPAESIVLGIALGVLLVVLRRSPH